MSTLPAALKLVVGLGNPGPDYTETRHNAGFWFLDRLADEKRVSFTAERKFHGETARLQSGGLDCRLLKPDTFMNRSGRAVQALAAYYQISAPEILVVHDEIDLPAGAVRLKQDGGHGGHNGLRDIIDQLGRKDFARLRLGVGHPGQSHEVINHVLQRPSAADRRLIDEAIDRALAIMPMLYAGEWQKAMTALHTTAGKDE